MSRSKRTATGLGNTSPVSALSYILAIVLVSMFVFRLDGVAVVAEPAVGTSTGYMKALFGT